MASAFGRDATRPLPPSDALPLMPGEEVCWHGRPARGFLLRRTDWFTVPFSLVWAGGAMNVWRTSADDLLVWGIRLLFTAVAIYITVGRFIYDAWDRARTHYAVTDRRVLIDRRGPFGASVSLPIDRLPPLTFRGDPGGRGTIVFGTHEFAGRRHRADPKFDSIDGAGRVRALLERLASGRGV